jgi:tRNA nucleotidyltransferase (CCA-adding enzyme)
MGVRTINIQTAFGEAQGHAARHVLDKLFAAGYEAYLVGGCVRDACMGQPIHDYDIATAAVPSQVMALFERCFPTGLAHGTVTVKAMGHLFEVTTFRTEAGYADHRHPDHVAFVTDIQEDLARRDFTINAIAVGCDGVMIDPYGGYDDVQAKRLRAVGEADVRFAEDPLRMMRGIRLAAQYALTIEPHTWQAIVAQRTRLRWIAMERVCMELQRMVAGEHPWRALALLAQSGLLAQCKQPLPLPPSLGVRHDDPATDPLALLPVLDNAHSRWALWLLQMDIHEEAFGVLMRALCVSNAFRLAVRQILAVHATVGIAVGDASEGVQRQWHHTVLMYGVEAVARWLDVAHVLVQTQALCAVRTPYAVHGKRWLTAMPLTHRHQLAIDGTFLLRMSGCASGKWVGACLDQMTWDVVQGNVINDRVHIAHHAFVWIGTAGRAYGIKRLPAADNVRILPLARDGLEQRLHGTRYIGNMHGYETIDSTQRMAKALARQGCPDGTIVLAEEQTDGRGTYAKTWYSPKQSALLMSVVLRPTRSPDRGGAALNLVLAVAVCHALKATTGLPVQIKWPNDLLIDGRKVCGLLSETVDRGAYWIAGIGVNVHLDYATVPAALHPTIGCLHHATRIHAAMQRAPTVTSAWTRHDVLVAILHEIHIAVPKWEQEGFAPFRPLWQQLAYTVGRTVTLQHNGRTIRGVATGVSATGHLCVLEERTGETVQVSSVRQLRDKTAIYTE